jgi:hypothetical protein
VHTTDSGRFDLGHQRLPQLARDSTVPRSQNDIGEGRFLDNTLDATDSTKSFGLEQVVLRTKDI